ncbi:glycosyl hydrolase [Candidatus Heimdallarchaeota archaeon B3_Heim]|nr:MAG: glycosyl hydrolase [Candidatus Heimdallarchaeota archaeon B3_Heim]
MDIIYSKQEIAHLPYRNSRLSLEKRVEDLLKRLTLDEKMRLLSGHRIFNTAPINRLGLGRLRMTDGPFGVAMHSSGLSKNTRFPSTKALAASWNRDLAKKLGEAIAEEVRANGRHMLLAPGINIDRTPLNGRTFEYFGEDPYLVKELAIPFVQGVQNQQVGACIKHFVANNQETLRKTISVEIDERTLHEIYLRAFEEVVKEAEPFSVMTCYNKVNGVYGSDNSYLLRETLFDKWGFEGMIVSDWGATVHKELTTKSCLKAGLSLEMPSGKKYKRKLLHKALSSGEIKEDLINDAIRRVLLVAGKTGVLDDPETLPKGVKNSIEHQSLSRKIAEEGMVLLKNEGILPLKLDSINSIAVLGPNMNKKFGKILYGGSSAVKAPYEVTPIEGVKEFCSKDVKLVHDPSEADVVLLFMGLNHNKDGGRREFVSDFFEKRKDALESGHDSEGADRAQLELPQSQVDLIKDTVKQNPNTVVILINGSPLGMNEWLNDVPAVLEAWYGGMEAGNAIANVLFGEINPSGKLPITFPEQLTDSPAHKSPKTYPGDLDDLKVYYEEGIYVGYRHFEKFDIAPLFPFGFGLSYTTFSYDNLSLSKNKVHSLDDTFNLYVDITNTGDRFGAEIVQIYANHLESNVDRPPKELVGFAKVELNSEEKQAVQISIRGKDLAYYDVSTHDWKLDEGIIRILVGSSSQDIHLETEIHFS